MKKKMADTMWHSEKDEVFYRKMVKIEIFFTMAHIPAIFLTNIEKEDECV
jgi:hypothetical protein